SSGSGCGLGTVGRDASIARAASGPPAVFAATTTSPARAPCSWSSIPEPGRRRSAHQPVAVNPPDRLALLEPRETERVDVVVRCLALGHALRGPPPHPAGWRA